MVDVHDEQSVPDIKTMIKDYRIKAKRKWNAMQRDPRPERQNYQRRYRKAR